MIWSLCLSKCSLIPDARANISRETKELFHISVKANKALYTLRLCYISDSIFEVVLTITKCT